MQLMRFIVLQATSRTVRVLPDQLKTAFYKIPVLSGGLRWVLTKAAPEGRVVMQVASGIGRGIRLRLDLKTQKYYCWGRTKWHCSGLCSAKRARV